MTGVKKQMTEMCPWVPEWPQGGPTCVTNRAVLQCVFQSWLVWIQGIDWQAGLSIHPQDMETLPAELAQPGARKTTDLGEAWSKFSFLDPLWLVRHGIFNPPGLLVHRCRNCTSKYTTISSDLVLNAQYGFLR